MKRLIILAAAAASGCATVSVQPSPPQIAELPSSGEAGPGRKLNPIYLADGRTILFSALVDGDWDLFVRAPDGRTRRWVPSQSWEGSPALWATAGRIAFERFDRNRGSSEMWSARPDGSDERRLGTAPGFRPEPSPDGMQLAYDNFVKVEPGRGSHQIFLAAIDGAGPARLTQTLSYDAAPTWSPDGRRLAFDSQRDDPSREINAARSEIYVMDRDGSNARRLTSLNGRSRYAAWSPRSNAIVFEALIDGNWDLYLVHADGPAAPIRLTSTPGAERTPSWSRDGRAILFAYEVDGQAELRTLPVPRHLR